MLSAESKDKKPLEVFISSIGKDSNKGLSSKSPIYSMKKAESIVRRGLWKNHGNVIIHIGSGVYKQQHTRWKFTMEDRNITFLGSSDNKPIFDGEGINATWLRIDHNHHTKTNIHIKNIQVQNYARAIFLHGSKKNKNKKADYNVVKNCTFKNIGDKYSSSKIGYAAISVMNSSFNLFENNQFINIENHKTVCKIRGSKKKCFKTKHHIHGLYLSYNSSFNRIKDNIFQNISGDAIKVRAMCNFNTIKKNKFSNIRNVFQDWYAHYSNAIDEDIIECPSWGNMLSDNIIGKTYLHNTTSSLVDIKIKYYVSSGQENYCNEKKKSIGISDKKMRYIHE